MKGRSTPQKPGAYSEVRNSSGTKGAIQLDIDSPSAQNLLLLRLLVVTYNAIMDAQKTEVKRFDIQFARSETLWCLKAMGGAATISEIAQLLDRDRHSTAQLLRRMEDDGLVSRQKGVNKRNAATIVITEEGERLTQQIAAKHVVIIDEIFSSLTSKQQETFREYLKKLGQKAIAMGAGHSRWPKRLTDRVDLTDF